MVTNTNCLRPRSGETEPSLFVRRAREIRDRIIERSGGGEGPDDEFINDILPEEEVDIDNTNTESLVDNMNARSNVILIGNQSSNRPVSSTQDSISTFVAQDSSTPSLGVASRVACTGPLASNTSNQLVNSRSTRRMRVEDSQRSQQNWNQFMETMQASMTQQQMMWTREAEERRLQREESERLYRIQTEQREREREQREREREERDRRYERDRQEQRDHMNQMMLMIFGDQRRNNHRDNDQNRTGNN